jgi:hypothetical protein
MEGKLHVLICYGLIGLIIALWPILVKEKVNSANFQCETSTQSSGWLWKFLCFLIAFLGAFFIAGRTIPSLILSFALIVSMLALSSEKFDIAILFSTFLALCVSTTLLWWHRHGHTLNINGFSTATICFFTFLFTQLYKINPNPSIKITGFSTWLISYMLFAALLSFSTGIFSNNTLIKTLWHHWGAYIGPAELLLSGAVIFHDFPAQYGLGPTLLIASVCGHDCWQGMYFITGLSIWLFSLCIASLAFALTPNRWPERLITLLLCLATCFFWTAFPPFTGSPLETPSVSGLRFLPVIFLVTYLFFVSHIEHSKIKSIIAHSLWVFGTLWSPESAFYVTCVWWPYYIFVRRVQGDISSRIKALIKAVTRLLLIAVSLTVIFNIIFRIIYGKGPMLYAFLAYALNPPGPLPINTHGGILYFLLVTSIGIISLFQLWYKSGDTFEFRSGFIIILLCYSVFSYFLGRSHDNTFLNISPFILLVLLYTLSTINNKKLSLHRMCVICLMALLGWLPVFGWEAWYDNISKGRLLSFNPKLLSDYLAFSNPRTLSETSHHSKNFNLDSSFTAPWNAINFLQRYKEPITVLNSTFSLMGSIHPTVWSAIHGPANYTFIPSNHRRQFLQATAKSLNRSGWLIVEKNSQAEIFLEDYDFAYQRTNYFDFGNYYAVRFTPKKSL